MGLFSRYAKAALFLGAYQVPLGLLIITYEFHLGALLEASGLPQGSDKYFLLADQLISFICIPVACLVVGRIYKLYAVASIPVLLVALGSCVILIAPVVASSSQIILIITLIIWPILRSFVQGPPLYLLLRLVKKSQRGVAMSVASTGMLVAAGLEPFWIKVTRPYGAFVPFASITAIFAVSLAGIVVAEKLYTKERHQNALPQGIRFSDKILQREKKKFADETPEIGLGFITIIISAIFIGVGLNGFSEFRMVSWNVFIKEEITGVAFLPTLFGSAYVAAMSTGLLSTRFNVNVAVSIGALLGFIGSVINEIPGSLAFPIIGTITLGAGYGVWFWSSLVVIRSFTKRAIVLGIYFGIFSLIKSNTFLVKLFVDEANLESTYKWLAPTFLAIGAVITCLGLYLLLRKLRGLLPEEEKIKNHYESTCCCFSWTEPTPYGVPSEEWYARKQKKLLRRHQVHNYAADDGFPFASDNDLQTPLLDTVKYYEDATDSDV